MRRRRRFFALASFVLLACAVCGALVAVFGRSQIEIAWSRLQRDGGQILVDGRSVELTEDETIRLNLNCLTSQVRMLRDGFEPIVVSFEPPHFFDRREVQLEWKPTSTKRLEDRLRSVAASTSDKMVAGGNRFSSTRRSLIDIAIDAKMANIDEVRRAATEALARLPHPLDRGVFDANEAKEVWTIGSRRLRHSGPAWQVAVSADGRWVASASEDAALAVFDALTGERIAEHLEHLRGIIALAVHPDSKRVLSCGYGGRIVLFDVESSQTTLLADRLGSAQSVTFSPSGELLAFGGKARLLRVLATESREVLLNKHFDDEIRQVAFLGGDTRLAVLLDGSLQVVDVETGDLQNAFGLEDLRDFDVKIDDFEVLKLGEQIAFRSNRQIVVLQLEARREAYRYRLPPNVVGKNSSPKWLAEFQTREPKNQIRFKTDGVDPIFIPIGKRVAVKVDANTERNVVAIGTAGGGVFIFRTDSEKLLEPVAPDRRWRDVAFDATGDRLILGASDGTLAIVDCYERRLLHHISGKGFRPRQLLVSRESNTLWVEDAAGLRAYALDNPGEQRSVANASGAAISDGGKLLAYSFQNDSRNELVVEELDSGRERTRMPLPKRLSQLVFAPDARELYGATRSGELFVIDADGGQRLMDAEPSPGLTALAMIGSTRLAIASRKQIRFFNVEEQEFETTTIDTDRPIRRVIASIISDTWFCVTDGIVHRYEGTTLVESIRPHANRTRFSSAHLSPDGRFVAIAMGDGRVVVLPCPADSSE